MSKPVERRAKAKIEAMKHKSWICIAWKKGTSESVCKEAKFKIAVDSGHALLMFQKAWPELRNHTVQPEKP